MSLEAANFGMMPLTCVVFGLTYLGLAAGRVPGSRIDRPGIAMVGAAAVLVAGVLSPVQAARAVDHRTLMLLFGMMIVAGQLRFAGAFALATDGLAAHCRGPRTLLAVVIGLSGLLSALLVNDVVCVALTPLVVDVCRRQGRPPLPYLIGLATAANVGSAATLTGNPQNMLIGSLSGISFARFAARLTPVAVAGLVLTYAIVALVYRRPLNGHAQADPVQPPRTSLDRGSLARSLSVFGGTVALFLAGLPIDLVALGAAAVLLLVGGAGAERAFEAVDWPLLVLFTGLFIVTHAFDVHAVRPLNLAGGGLLGDRPILALGGLTALLSNLVSNVPAVLLMRPLIEPMDRPEPAWLALAVSSTLAGNLTVLGSVANLIVVEAARRSGIELGFFEYLKVGIPLTAVSTLMGLAWLILTHY